MSELGAGTGSSYPSAIDTDSSQEQDNVTKARAACINDAVAAIIAIENTLGTNPQGTKTDVKTLLQIEHNTDGTHKTITVGGVAMTSTPTANAPAMFDSNGIMKGGELAMDGETSASGATSPQQITLSVTSGDRVFIQATALCTAGTYSQVLIQKASGANGNFNGSLATVGNYAFSLSNSTPTASGIWNATATGSVTFSATYTTSGGSLTTLSIYAFFLKKQ